MNGSLNDILDTAIIAFEEEGVQEWEVRDAIVDALSFLAAEKLGTSNELVAIFDSSSRDDDIVRDLDEFNAWKNPNERLEETNV